MLVKSVDEGSHLDDLQETFETLKQYKMKLNPSKCAFGVSLGKFLSFMDAFSVYNQIKMDEADQEKTSFITSQGLFCYKVMPFGLKNAGATYQRLVNHMFRPHACEERRRGKPFG